MPWIVIGSLVLLGLVFYELIDVSVNAQLQLLRSGNAPAGAAGASGVAATTRQLEETLEQIRPAHVDELGVSLVAGIGSVLLIVFAASHTGTEYGWGTLRTLLASGASRAHFLVAKLASLAVFAVVFTALGVAAVIAGSYVVSLQAGYDTSGLDVPTILSASSRAVYAFVPYMALASLIALWSRSSGAGIAAGLVIYFAESIVMQLLISFNRDFATIANLGLSRNIQSLSRVTVNVAGTNPSNASSLPDQTQAALVLAAWTAAFIVLAFWRLRARDVTL
jgi:ABC-2 type transport system permease protein